MEQTVEMNSYLKYLVLANFSRFMDNQTCLEILKKHSLNS